MMLIQYMPDYCWLGDVDDNSVYARLFVGREMMILIQYMPDWFNEDDANSRNDDGNSVYARLFVGLEMRRLIQFTQVCLMMRYVNADSDHTKLSVGGNMMMLIQYKVEYLLVERS
ncbi:Hypothetical predicted protein [Mytilus galloprovincialis]|uniref:Uncharacterized protein n=1 Tax=Mytilus galloprovincialis TaxID=29158 RepID=A0A8B6FAT9_MYTGA|nr:Hypothetical predicted protein [Mytilus galloprovincialis]